MYTWRWYGILYKSAEPETESVLPNTAIRSDTFIDLLYLFIELIVGWSWVVVFALDL